MADENDVAELRDLLAECVDRDYLGHHAPDAWHRRALAALERIGWNVTYLRETGTVAFDLDTMLGLIRMDPVRIGHLNLGEWLQFVPELFRGMAEAQAQLLFDEEWRGRAFSEDQRRQFVAQLSRACVVRARDIQTKAENPATR
jgi:hypothetical protein